MSAKRSPFNAFVMSCLCTGWGLVYVGRCKWAIRTACLMYGGMVLAGLMGWIAQPYGVYAYFGFLVLVKLTSAIASSWLAYRPDESQALPSVRYHITYVATVLGIGLVLLSPLKSAVLGYQTYEIPTGSMIPTLSLGDHIVTDTRYNKPKVGDIVVYRYNGIEATKRVAGIAGDTLAIVNGELINNGQNLGLFFAPANRIKEGYSLSLAPLKVEAGHVYLLGDNRDNSNDSRFMGQVAVSDITSRVTGIWYSPDRSRVGRTFD